MSKNKSVGSTFDRLPCATSTRDTLFIRDLSNLTINIDRFVIVATEESIKTKGLAADNNQQPSGLLSISNSQFKLVARTSLRSFQLTKEFADAGSAEALRVSTTFSTARDVFQKAINDGAIQAKKDELAFWEDKCALASCYEAAAVIVKTTYEDRKSSYKLPVFSTDNKGVRRIAEWVTSPQKKAECSALQTILPAIFSHIKQIVKLRHRALAIKIEKKRSTAATADVEMADATKPGPSIQSLIDKGLNARLKKLNLGYTSSGQSSSKAPQPQAKKTGPSKPKSSSTPSQRKPQTKASNKVDNKKKGKGRAPVKNNNPKGKGKARA
ncbi:hypothetical protein JR316_0005493 [Psilocybe cubensis]|uniref:Uncharacterized protein n=2 Tax=Psilocybe cubensis TaxID=181762 RepID=A0ACB8H6R6_PSICU|nr:hypothetical protein JR316_0005488 [Psilocybe cubensis]XP_047751012.1 hypothetical protein JR316_0005493 [Psilocybe cubensis]KAH9483382.1 hypothetical protein JR316_0005488 [Psilocybe cubensis]KAH9483387.1 hypothetical protein JR316_0005493 [Psilocybe cubensis]